MRSIFSRHAQNVGTWCMTAGATGVLAAGLIAGLALAAETEAGPGSWSRGTPMPETRNEVTAVAANDRIYVLGGSYDLTRNEEYDPATRTWRSRAPLPAGASHVSATVQNGKIYAVGGFTGRDHKGAVDRVFEYDVAADTWRALAPLSTPRGSVGVAALDGKIHAIGGREEANDSHSRGVIGTHEVFDPATGRWTQAAPLPRPRDHMVVVAVDGKIHAVGGRFAGNDDMMADHDVYDPATNAWTSAPPLPTARGGVGGTVYKGLILALGGEDEKRTYNENEGYDLKAGRWLKLAPMPTGRHGHGVAALGSSAYVFAGALQRGGREVTGDVLVFNWP
jgi:N-acetylneuraminic acid mutarotase